MEKRRMQKTGSFILFILLTLSTFQLQAQNRDDISVTASVSNTIIFEGEQFALNLEVSGSTLRNANRPEIPPLDGLTLMSRVPSTSSSISVVNGVTSATYGFRYILRGARPGTYTIPSFRFIIDGQTYQTDPIQVEIVKREEQQQRQDLPEIYLQLELSTDSPYVGQQMIAKVVLYFKNEIDILSYNPSSTWRTEGFWLHNLNEDGEAPRAESVIIKGMRYRKAELSAFALFPTRAGTLYVGEYSIRANIRFSGRFDDATQRFFSGFGRTQRNLELQSEAKEIRVKRLPTPQPEGFSGAVGSFSVSREVADKNISLGDPVELVTRVEGRGNISLINHPKFEIPEAFERFQPQENTNLQTRSEMVRGVKTFTDVLIARQSGSFDIPATEYYWFDPGTGRYRSQTLPAIPLMVRRDLSQVSARVDESRLNLRPVVGVTEWRTMHQQMPLRIFWLFLLGLLPFIIFAAGKYRRNYVQKMRTDSVFFRHTNAEQFAVKTLTEAQQHASRNQWRDAYGLMHRAISVCISDRLNLPATGQSDSEIAHSLLEKSQDSEFSKQVKLLLNRFSTIQYAPESMIESFENDLMEARNIIQKVIKLT